MIRTWAVVSVCALHIIACGDDDDSHVSSGLPASSKLSSLDDAQAQKLCKSLASSFNNVVSDSDKKRISCTVLALPLSIKQSSTGKVEGDVPKCKGLVTRCLNGETISTAEPAFEVQDEFIDESSCTEANASENLAECDASVSEFESCASAMLDAVSGQFDIISCDSLSDPEKLMEMTSEGPELDTLPQCKALNTKCPDLEFGDSSDDSDTLEGDDSSSGT
jgi:hypothetical protein